MCLKTDGGHFKTLHVPFCTVIIIYKDSLITLYYCVNCVCVHAIKKVTARATVFRDVTHNFG
jgi:hypothetical protein